MRQVLGDDVHRDAAHLGRDLVQLGAVAGEQYEIGSVLREQAR
jgi:hypothetical protein